jgi:hypothetical protein
MPSVNKQRKGDNVPVAREVSSAKPARFPVRGTEFGTAPQMASTEHADVDRILRRQWCYSPGWGGEGKEVKLVDKKKKRREKHTLTTNAYRTSHTATVKLTRRHQQLILTPTVDLVSQTKFDFIFAGTITRLSTPRLPPPLPLASISSRFLNSVTPLHQQQAANHVAENLPHYARFLQVVH